MISGHNPSNVELDFDELEKYGKELFGANSVSLVIDNLQERRENVLKGGTNCIPFPFERFKGEIPGVEQGQYVIVTAAAKSGKTQIANFLYVFNTLEYAFTYPGRCSVHIIYFALEESVQRIIERYMSYLLYKLDGIRIAPSDLRSTSIDNPVPQEILDLFKQPKYRDRLDFFEKCVEFDTENTNPTGILRTCEAYAKKVGKYKSHKEKSKGTFSDKEVEVFDSYTQNDPNHYKIVVIDHIGLVDKEQGFKTKDAIDKMSEYLVKYLRNRYNYTCVVIQQQAGEGEGLEAVKQKKMIPTMATLGDSKFTGRDCNLALGLFDPSKFGQKDWGNYIIQDETGYGLRNFGRFMYVLANRDGEMGGICSLFFDGAVCNFEELPKASDPDIKKYYDRVKKIREYRQQKTAQKKVVLLVFIHINNKQNEKIFGRNEDKDSDAQDAGIHTSADCR